MHRGMADMMKAMGGAKRGPMAQLANAHGLRRRHAVAGRDAEDGREDAAAGWRRIAARHAAEYAGMPGLPGLGGGKLPGLGGGYHGIGKKK